jgi:hypothetical protein
MISFAVQRDKTYLNFRQSMFLLFVNALNGFATGFFGRSALAHQLNYEMTTRNPNYLFAMTRRRCRTYFAINV